MNPISAVSSNVIQFGFSTTFDLENGKIIFDITEYTIYAPGGIGNVVGVNFEVVDPAGSQLSVIDFPNVDINPNEGPQTYEVALNNSPSMYGYYYIRGVLQEVDGRQFGIELKKNVCKPEGIKDGVVPGKFKDTVDCTIPRISISEVTNMVYQSKNPQEVVKNGVLYYPPGTLPALAFDYTPFEVIGSGNVYTGDYTVRNKSIAEYDLGELVSVKVTYNTTHKFSVTCNDRLCELLCCVEKLQQVATEQCDTAVGVDARKKLSAATIPLLSLIAKEKCGQDASDLVTSVAKMLGCDCSCDASLNVEPKPIISTFEPLVLEGSCGTNVIPLGANRYRIKSLTVSVDKKNVGDLALLITSKQTECNKSFLIELDKDRLIRDQMDLIKNSPELYSIFNSLVQQQTIDFSPIGANCIVDLTKSDYDLIEDAANSAKQVVSVTIDGTVFLAPSGLSITNTLAIEAWLNSLSKGAFDVYFDTATSPDTTVIRALDNSHAISVMVFSLSGTQLVRQFSKNSLSIVEMFKLVIEYLCNLTESDIKLGASYTICTVKADGTIDKRQLSPDSDVTLATFLAEFQAAYCASIDQLVKQSALSCERVKKVFVDTSPIVGDDGVLGTRSGKCGLWKIEDLVTEVLDFLLETNEQALIDKFCQIKNRCTVPVCNPVTYSTGELIEPCPAITNISGVFTN
jgi:hypothetical protein